RYRVAGGRFRPRAAPPWGRGSPGPNLAHTGEKTRQPDTPDICARLASGTQARLEKSQPPTERATGAAGAGTDEGGVRMPTDPIRVVVGYDGSPSANLAIDAGALLLPDARC